MDIGINTLVHEVIKRMSRVPRIIGYAGDGKAIARQLDAALMTTGFKLSKNLLEHLSSVQTYILMDYAKDVLTAVRELVGDHVWHNVYFRDFPHNVPDTQEFWFACLTHALSDPESRGKVFSAFASVDEEYGYNHEEVIAPSLGTINLLDLPTYGRYQHTYEEMLAFHDVFMPNLSKDRVTVLHLGETLLEETLSLYQSLAQSTVPLNETDRVFLGQLARLCLNDPQPETIPVRENRAIINAVRILNDCQILVDTCTDVLRLACALAGGDVTLEKPTKFKSFSKSVRRGLMEAFDRIVTQSPAKLADVAQYREMYKRLGERLHPHEFAKLSCGRDVFAVARGDMHVQSLAAKVEVAFGESDISQVISLLASAPGMLFRNLDRILRSLLAEESDWLKELQMVKLFQTLESVISKVSGRVILSVREHLQNRLTAEIRTRVFANSKGTAWVTPEIRNPLDAGVVQNLFEIFDKEIASRLPACDRLVIDAQIMDLALPLSNKNKASGFGVMSRGSVLPVTDGILRFFVYWKQKQERTDYDLSLSMLDENFQPAGQVSWTNLREGNIAVHSGDIVEAHNGASEFIDIDLKRVDCTYLIPSVNMFAGENFTEVEECLFGFMERTPEQRGKPFEPVTVRMKSDMRGKGKVALPLVFFRNDKGKWVAKWMHLYLNGMEFGNRVETNKATTSVLARAIVDRTYLPMSYLVTLMMAKATSVHYGMYGIDEPVTYVGLEAPEGLPAGSHVYTLANLHDLIPA